MYCTLYNYADPPDRFFARGWQELFGYEAPKAAKKARCHDFIMALPGGYDTVIGDGGACFPPSEFWIACKSDVFSLCMNVRWHSG